MYNFFCLAQKKFCFYCLLLLLNEMLVKFVKMSESVFFYRQPNNEWRAYQQLDKDEQVV